MQLTASTEWQPAPYLIARKIAKEPRVPQDPWPGIKVEFDELLLGFRNIQRIRLYAIFFFWT
jgi:hypothetical protein